MLPGVTEDPFVTKDPAGADAPAGASAPARTDDLAIDWAAVLDTDCAVPANRPLDALVAELTAMLTAADPHVRDDTAYPILVTWIGRGVLDGTLGDLGDTIAAMHTHPQIQARTFATLALGWVIRRDAVAGEVDTATVRRWRDEFAAWWLAETDLRGYDDRLGWLHAIAHGADTVRALARSPRLDATDLAGLLDLSTARLLAPTDYLFAHGEDDRLSYAIASILTRPELADRTGWLVPVAEALSAVVPGPVPAFAANTFRTLNSLYVAVDRGVTWYHPQTREPSPVTSPPDRAEICAAIADVLRDAVYYLG